MLIHPTVERLRALGLSAMADALVAMESNPDAAELPHADWLGLLIDREATARDNRRLARRLQVAKLRQAASVENVDYRSSRGLDRALFQTLATSQWVREHQHLAITGPTGTGKSWLACALGHRACRDGFSVLYKRAPRLFADLAQARGEGRLARLMTTLERTQLLIIDDWGPEPLSAEQRRDLLEIVDDRYDKGSLLITSQVPVSRWYDVVGAQPSATRSWTACSTLPIVSSSRAKACAAKRRRGAWHDPQHPRSPPQTTGPSRARRCAAHKGRSAPCAGPSHGLPG